MSVAFVVIAVGVLLVAAVAIVCLFSPVKIAMRAPHENDLFLFEVRHPALLVDLALDAATVMGWALGERKLPRFRAEVAGIRVREVWLEWAARKAWALALKEIERRRAPSIVPPVPRPNEPPKKPGIPKLALARESFRALQTVGAVERLVLKVEFGTGDPATTAMVVSGALFLEPFLPDEAEIDLQPYWSEAVLRIEGEGRAELFPWRAVRAILSLALWRSRTGTAATAMATATAAPSNRS